MKFSQRRRLRSNDGSVGEDKTFPFFIWLLRDVTQSIPTDCRNIKEYFLTRVRQLIFETLDWNDKRINQTFPWNIICFKLKTLQNSLFQRQKYWLYHCFLGLHSYNLSYHSADCYPTIIFFVFHYLAIAHSSECLPCVCVCVCVYGEFYIHGRHSMGVNVYQR